MELERILQRQGFGSRKTCRGLIRAGRVTVRGETCEDPYIELETEGLEFAVDGEDWQWREQATLMLHKPVGHECSRHPIHHPSVYRFLPAPLLERGVQSIGRLDEDTSGLLLFTDDGQLNHRLSSPRHRVPKIYRVTVKHAIEPGMVQALLTGVLLHDEPERLSAAACEPLDSHVLRLTINEGKYHQVKRMIAAAGNRVEALHREALGGLRLPADLQPGEWCWLSAADLQALES